MHCQIKRFLRSFETMQLSYSKLSNGSGFILKHISEKSPDKTKQKNAAINKLQPVTVFIKQYFYQMNWSKNLKHTNNLEILLTRTPKKSLSCVFHSRTSFPHSHLRVQKPPQTHRTSLVFLSCYCMFPLGHREGELAILCPSTITKLSEY